VASDKRHKTASLEIHEEKKVPVDNVPAGSVFKGYQEYIIQNMIISNTSHSLPCWINL
jgi:hypothetical protein